MEKSVIIHRDENGFGLRVGGQNPVCVDCVHENGAAWKAGVRKDDLIIKVNGTLVKSYDHQSVVNMIQNCTPFVNLTLHSPEPVSSPECFANAGVSGMINQYTISVDQNNGNMTAVSLNGQTITQTPNSNNLHPQIQFNQQQQQSHKTTTYGHLSHHHFLQSQRRHPYSVPDNASWLLQIGDDLFQDCQQKQQHSGVGKLVVGGPNPLSHSNSNLSASSRHTKSQSSNTVRQDNPYYYYKTTQHLQQDRPPPTLPDYSASNTCNTNNPSSTSLTTSSSTASLLMNSATSDQQQLQHQQSSHTAARSNPSMVRSRSSTKMSTRSTTGKYAKARNLRSRLVEDLRSLAIAPSQTTSSSLSTSPSSSDLSDCDDLSDQTNARLDSGLTLNSSNLSRSPKSGNTIMIGASGVSSNLTLQQMQQQQYLQHQQQIHHNSGVFNISDNNNKSFRITTRRLEIIRELVDTEKTHIEKLKQLNDLLYKPIKAENLIPPDQLKMVFSCHKTLFKIHRQIYKKLLAAQVNYSEQPHHFQQNLQEPLVGRALIEIFGGELGERLEKAACSFCACQSTNTDLLNRITRKDTKSGEFLAQVANQQMLGRLGIKDLLASCFQRLTKYPLLLDNLLKATPNLAASESAAAKSNNSAPSLGMMHAKSLSEGSISIPSKTVVSSINNINNNNNDNGEEGVEEQVKDNNSSSSRLANDPDSSQVSNRVNDSIMSDKSSTSNLSTLSASKNSSRLSSSPSSKHNYHKNIEEHQRRMELQSADTNNLSATNSNNTSTASTTTIDSTATTIDGPASSSLSDEYAYERFCIERALQSSRQLLIHVNEAVNRAIARGKLKELWKKTDKSQGLSVIDIDNEQLLHEGSLTLRLNKRQYDVHLLLLSHYLVILTREGQDKYKLKFFPNDGKLITIDGKTIPAQLSPIFNLDEHLVTRDSATDESGFYVLCKSKDLSRIYEFVTHSPMERAKWKEKIHMAQLHNFPAVPDDDNTLTRYTELISLTNSDQQTPQSSMSTAATSSGPLAAAATTSASIITPVVTTATSSASLVSAPITVITNSAARTASPSSAAAAATSATTASVE